jgi:hypothetical protein
MKMSHKVLKLIITKMMEFHPPIQSIKLNLFPPQTLNQSEMPKMKIKDILVINTMISLQDGTISNLIQLKHHLPCK